MPLLDLRNRVQDLQITALSLGVNLLIRHDARRRVLGMRATFRRQPLGTWPPSRSSPTNPTRPMPRQVPDRPDETIPASTWRGT